MLHLLKDTISLKTSLKRKRKLLEIKPEAEIKLFAHSYEGISWVKKQKLICPLHFSTVPYAIYLFTAPLEGPLAPN